MSILASAGKLFRRTGALVSAAAQACITACCGGWFCCWDDAFQQASTCQDTPCPSGLLRSSHATQEECLAACIEPPPTWYCCWDTPEPRPSDATSHCQPSPCDEGYAKGAATYGSESECDLQCSVRWDYYCCVDLDTYAPGCYLGWGCPGGTEFVFGPLLQNGYDCNVCTGEITGACCHEPELCADDTVNNCSTTSTYFVKDECGVCQQASAPEGLQYFASDCRVYDAYPCSSSSPIGWTTAEACQTDGYISVPCDEGVPSYQCYGPGLSWHPGLMCYQVNCPGDCYDTNTISPCDGSAISGTYSPCLFFGSGSFCAIEPEITVEFTGVSSSVSCYSEGSEEDYCTDATTTAVRAFLASALNSAFTFPLNSSNCNDYAETYCDYTPYTMPLDPDIPGVLFADITITLERYDPLTSPNSNTTPDTIECGKNVCYRVRVDWAVSFCPDPEWTCADRPNGCYGGYYLNCGTVYTQWHCAHLTVNKEKTAACSCFPIYYNCNHSVTGLTFETMSGWPGCVPGCCLEDLFNGATASITFAA